MCPGSVTKMRVRITCSGVASSSASAAVRHLLAHASGWPPEEGGPVSRAGARRIYSNAGFDVLGALVAERAEMPFAEYVSEALAPLGTGLELRGRPAGGVHGSLTDL